jgi:hypothetical protein
VTVATRHVNVRALEGETGLQIVVESPPVPGDRIVAGATLIVEIAAMRIFVLMAGHTLRVRTAKCLRLMAVFALCFTVLAKQRKCTQVMVKEHRVLPVDFRVAGLALSTQRLLMDVILKMARLTAGVERHFENRINVAVVTCGLEVTAE